VVVRYGRSVEDGFLPVFSVGSEEEAERLLTMACPLGYDGEYLAPELIEEQTFEQLGAFGARLKQLHERLVEVGRCDCARA
jgi:hypothetical protein